MERWTALHDRAAQLRDRLRRLRIAWPQSADVADADAAPSAAPRPALLHIAPEAALAPRLHAILGDGYEPVDIAPDQYPFAPGIRRFDLVTDAPALPSGAYDLILHSHVMEHVRGNVTAILFHLHRALKPGGRSAASP